MKQTTLILGLFIILTLTLSACATKVDSETVMVEDDDVMEESDNTENGDVLKEDTDVMIEDTDVIEEIKVIPNDKPSGDAMTSPTGYTLTDVVMHNNRKDCWMAIDDKVYDVTGYETKHPGGTTKLTDSCGLDATELFDTKGKKDEPHKQKAYDLLEDFYVGDLIV